ncbi:MAG: MATE family efflux transporter, partial [Oscillospiraceae bacterium]
MSSGENTILKGKIFPPLIKFTIPLMLAVLLQALYGAVDLIVVGKFGTTSSVAAVANGSQLMHTLTGFIAGLSMGVTVLIGRFVGAKDDEKAARTIGGMLKLFSVVAIILTVVMVALADKIAVLMQVPAEALDQTVAYLRICSAGTIFIVAYNAISGLFRGLGDSKSPLLFIFIACIVNVIGDLILVGIFKLDAAGAAYA